MTPTAKGRKIRVRGLVQGVGYRPFVWRLAHDAGLVGYVRNDGEGVEIFVWGATRSLDIFTRHLTAAAPPLARVDTVTWEPIATSPSAPGFRIVESETTDIATGIVPDAATCPQCRAEVFDPKNRRFGYAFTNCTHCGPRLSIIEGHPLRPGADLDAGFRHVPGMRPRVWRSGRPALPCPAQCLPGLRASRLGLRTPTASATGPRSDL